MAARTTETRFIKGARVGYVVEPSAQARAVETGETEDRIQREAYLLAMANQHKSWARRWLKVRRPGKLW